MVTGLWYTHDLTFGSLFSFWRCKEHLCPFSPDLGFQRTLEVANWGLASGSWFEYGQWSLVYPWSKFWLFILIWRCKKYACPLSPDMGLWRTLEVPDWGFAPWYWFGYGHWSLFHPYSEFWLSILILKMQRTSMSFKSSFGALEDAGGSWRGFAPWYWFG